MARLHPSLCPRQMTGKGQEVRTFCIYSFAGEQTTCTSVSVPAAAQTMQVQASEVIQPHM